jgi:hypothetical protein
MNKIRKITENLIRISNNIKIESKQTLKNITNLVFHKNDINILLSTIFFKNILKIKVILLQTIV